MTVVAVDVDILSGSDDQLDVAFLEMLVGTDKDGLDSIREIILSVLGSQ